VNGKARWGVCLVAFLIACLACHGFAGNWDVARAGWKYEFPRDHGNHGTFKTEWWYFTGNVRSAKGDEFGYQLTFFRQGVVPPGGELPGSSFLKRDVPFAHFAVTEIQTGKFHHFQRVRRGVFGEAGFEKDGRLAWVGNWTCEQTAENEFRLKAGQDGVAIDLALKSLKDPVAHGVDGISRKGEGEGRASHYYSLTRMLTRGTIRIGGKVQAVEGLSWFDHEWATNQLSPNQAGWDWFSLQFEDGSELMLFQIRRKEGGRDSNSAGTFVGADHVANEITNGEFRLTPTTWWTSPGTGGRYPVAWEISIPTRGIELTVRALVDGQELAGDPFSYWEGAVKAAGRVGGKPKQGRGYLEMTGYAGEVVGIGSR